MSRDDVHFVAARVAHLDPWSGVYTQGDGSVRRIADLADGTLLSRLI